MKSLKTSLVWSFFFWIVKCQRSSSSVEAFVPPSANSSNTTSIASTSCQSYPHHGLLTTTYMSPPPTPTEIAQTNSTFSFPLASSPSTGTLDEEYAQAAFQDDINGYDHEQESIILQQKRQRMPDWEEPDNNASPLWPILGTAALAYATLQQPDDEERGTKRQRTAIFNSDVINTDGWETLHNTPDDEIASDDGKWAGFLSESLKTSYHPLVRKCLYNLAVVDLLEEKLDEYHDEKYCLEEEQQRGAEFGMILAESDQQWLASYSEAENQLIEHLASANLRLQKRKQQCLDENIIDEDGSPIDIEKLADNIVAGMSPWSTDQDDQNQSRHLCIEVRPLEVMSRNSDYVDYTSVGSGCSSGFLVGSYLNPLEGSHVNPWLKDQVSLWLEENTAFCLQSVLDSFVPTPSHYGQEEPVYVSGKHELEDAAPQVSTALDSSSRQSSEIVVPSTTPPFECLHCDLPHLHENILKKQDDIHATLAEVSQLPEYFAELMVHADPLVGLEDILPSSMLKDPGDIFDGSLLALAGLDMISLHGDSFADNICYGQMVGDIDICHQQSVCQREDLTPKLCAEIDFQSNKFIGKTSNKAPLQSLNLQDEACGSALKPQINLPSSLFENATSCTRITAPLAMSSSPTSSLNSELAEKMSQTCILCSREFSRQGDLRKHFKYHEKPIKCPMDTCEASFGTKKDLKRHMKGPHGDCGEILFCLRDECHARGVKFTRKDNLMRHMSRKHQDVSDDKKTEI